MRLRSYSDHLFSSVPIYNVCVLVFHQLRTLLGCYLSMLLLSLLSQHYYGCGCCCCCCCCCCCSCCCYYCLLLPHTIFDSHRRSHRHLYLYCLCSLFRLIVATICCCYEAISFHVLVLTVSRHFRSTEKEMKSQSSNTRSVSPRPCNPQLFRLATLTPYDPYVCLHTLVVSISSSSFCSI